MIDAPHTKNRAGQKLRRGVPLSSAHQRSSPTDFAQQTENPAELLEVEKYVQRLKARRNFWVGRLNLSGVSSCQK